MTPEEKLETFGVLTAHDAGSWQSTLQRLQRCGRVVRKYPGVYVLPDRAAQPEVRIRAALSANPRGTLLGSAALWATAGWDLPVDELEMSGARSRSLPGLRIRRLTVPSDWTSADGELVSCLPAFAVADLAAIDNGAAIDRYLREGGGLDAVRSAAECMRHWSGAIRRNQVINASRARPWSQPERLLHAILFDARIGGWVANYPLMIGTKFVYIDVAFCQHRLAIEVDGYAFHSDRAAFESDRARQNQLVHAGWRVLRFTWASLQDREEVLRLIRAEIAHRSR